MDGLSNVAVGTSQRSLVWENKIPYLTQIASAMISAALI